MKTYLSGALGPSSIECSVNVSIASSLCGSLASYYDLTIQAPKTSCKADRTEAEIKYVISVLKALNDNLRKE